MRVEKGRIDHFPASSTYMGEEFLRAEMRREEKNDGKKREQKEGDKEEREKYPILELLQTFAKSSQLLFIQGGYSIYIYLV